MNESDSQLRLFQLVQAIKRGNLEEMASILADNPTAIVNRFSSDPAERFPPLHFAVIYPKEDVGIQMVKLLLEKGADPCYKDLYQQTILYYIARDGRCEIARLLLKNYPALNVNHTDGELQTPIYYAAREGWVPMIALLAEHGAVVSHKDKNFQTCLFYAAREGKLEACKALANLGVEVQHQDKKKKNAASFAKERNQWAVVDFLSSFRADDRKGKELQKVSGGNKVPPLNIYLQDSSFGQKKKQKKDAPKQDFVMVFTDQAGNMHELDEAELEEFKRHHERIFNLLENPDLLDESTTSYQQEKQKFLKTANRILTNCMKSKHGYLFLDPVDPVKLNIPDYFHIVKRPMCFNIIKIKLNNNAYDGHSGFVEDMMLVLDNCILYNGSENAVGKAALELKFDLNNMIKQFYQV